MLVTKRDGTITPIDLGKIHNMLEWACDGLKKVSVSDIEINAKLQFFNKIKTSDIQGILLKSSVDLISERAPDYEYVAARLLLTDLRKKVYGQFKPISFEEIFYKNIEEGKYNKDILLKYTKEEIKQIGDIIDYSRDFSFTYAGLRQCVDKYLVQNRKTKELYELPQEMFLSIGIYMFQNYPKDSRLKYIESFYNLVSTHKISLPSPIISGVRTNRKQFASCCLIDVDDSIDSIVSSKTAVAKYTAMASGIGLNFGRIRGLDAEVRGGDVLHTGQVPFLKSFEATTKEWTQNGMRGGSATVNNPFFTWDIENIVHLKSTKSTEENQVRGMDYVIHIDDLFLERVKENKDITLFSMEEAKELYEAFYTSSSLFKETYTKFENKRGIRKKKINARQLLIDILNERFETGRIYLLFANNVRDYNRFNTPVTMTNLCVEILLGTTPINHIDDKAGRIATCILACVNLGKINTEEELKVACDIMVRFLDELIDYQEYPVEAARMSTTSERNLGIGISDFFHFLAKNKVKYNSQEGIDLTHSIMEKFQYYLLLSSSNLAKEKGKCTSFSVSKYSNGFLPIDSYSPHIDSVCHPVYSCDWEYLRNNIKEYGLRNCVVSAIPPTASSSLVSNSTAGIDAPRSLLTTKVSKKGTVKQLVPEFTKLSQYYTTAWELDNTEYLKLIGVMQKFIDQSISTNEYFEPNKYPDNNVPITELIKNVFTASKLGIKTLYYCNTNDGAGEDLQGCDGGACAV